MNRLAVTKFDEAHVQAIASPKSWPGNNRVNRVNGPCVRLEIGTLSIRGPCQAKIFGHGDTTMQMTREIFEAQQQRRFGTSNPERMSLEFWEWMVKTLKEASARDWSDREDTPDHMPHQLRVLFGQEGDYSKGPVWNFDRMGATRTPHPDGRMICIAGEHEDHYDPDFCIYNDVIVIDLDGSVAIYGYPKDVFPPTDFHSASLLGDRIIVVGRLGYQGERHPGTTPVFALDLASYQIQELPSHGGMPGWIFKHEAVVGPEGITINGGEICEEVEGQTRIRRNFDDFLYDVPSGQWKRLTDRKWRQFSICNLENKSFMKGEPFTGGCSMDAEPWRGERPEVTDFSDTFIFVKSEALFPRSFEYESIYSEDYSPEERFTVDGIDISIKFASSAIEIMIEGDMDEAKANALIQDIKGSVEADTGRTCVVKNYL